MIEQLLLILIGMVATVMVSTISESAISAISLVESINLLFVQLFSAMGAGGAVVAAQYLGKKEPLNASKAAKQLLYVSLIIASFFALLCCIFCGPLLHLIFGRLPEDVFEYCRTFLYYSALSYPALALYNGGAALLRAMGDSKSSMFTCLLMNVVNAGISALLIFGIRMNVAGAGLASLLARLLGAVVIVRLLLNPTGSIFLIHPWRMEPDKAMIGRIFRLGIPNGLENSMFQIGKLLVSSIVASYSIATMSANAVGNNLSTLFYLPGTAIGLALITVVGQCIGAGDYAQAKHYTLKLLALVYGSMAASNLFLFLFAAPMVSLFHISPEGAREAVDILRLFAVGAIVFWPVSFTLPNALRAAGDAKFTMTVSMLCMWVCRVVLSYVLAYNAELGLFGIWLAMIIDWIARSVFFVIRYRSGKWLTKCVV